MRTIIAGGRDFSPKQKDWWTLDQLLLELPITTVVSGCARGADTFGENWAKENNIPIEKYPALWDVHGHAAGPIRNRLMAENAEALIAFPGGNGTKNMITTAHKLGLKVYEV